VPAGRTVVDPEEVAVVGGVEGVCDVGVVGVVGPIGEVVVTGAGRLLVVGGPEETEGPVSGPVGTDNNGAAVPPMVALQPSSKAQARTPAIAASAARDRAAALLCLRRTICRIVIRPGTAAMKFGAFRLLQPGWHRE
jgi:hypothetical protein